MNIKAKIVGLIHSHANELEIQRAEYEYITLTETHFVYIHPPGLIDIDNKQELLSKIHYEIAIDFPSASFAFIDNNSLTKLESPELIYDANLNVSFGSSGKIKSHILPDPFEEYEIVSFPSVIPVVATTKSGAHFTQQLLSEPRTKDQSANIKKQPLDPDDLFLAA